MPKLQHKVRIVGETLRIYDYKPPRRGRPPQYEVTTYRVAPAALEAALQLAGGDPSRLVPQRDGSVVVKNHGRA
ncbi:hypothetical protein [Actinomadura sp. WMMB 499]|uniref:hypothetical protein n=1 Tax=Actinomadura sp. WMMB 499 TaxID=1219491 RepID=UPI001243C1B6|nr:hypothetical protein [Actinomadura sp. WMMB 499]QFG25410.1 hypothetical protein F7P10_33900 [Actinomadura sp. WMMB 499]